MRKFFTWLLIILGIFIVLLIMAYIFISAFFDTEPMVPAHAYLTMRLSGFIEEYKPPDPLGEYFEGSSLDMKKIRQCFQYAAVDDRISGVILEIEYVQAGFAKLHELSQEIAAFRQSGKKVLALLNLALPRDYYLATACDSIYLQPEGTILLTGFVAEVSFYKDLLKKLGIEADYEHVGKYKNAPDVYTRQTMTEEQKEVINTILDSRYHDLVTTIALNRNLAEAEVENLIDTVTGFSADLALEYKLIDGTKYSDQLPDLLKAEEPDKLSRMSALEYANIDPESVGFGKGLRLALIYCQGTMMDGEDGNDPVFGTTMGANRVIRNLRLAAETKSIKAIILRIDSPGGLATAADEIWHAIMEARKKKPVIASISDVGASGGYYMAIAADTIVVQGPSLIGSIGVFIGKFSLEELYNKIGINVTTLQRGKNAGLLNLNQKFTDSERKVVRRLIENSYCGFVNKVAESRKRSFEEVDQIAQGRVWTGKQGLDLNLADREGGLEEAILIARKMSGIKPDEKVRLIVYPKSRSVLSEIMHSLSVSAKVVKNPVQEMDLYFKRIQSRSLYLLPFILTFN
jgi:protease-4